jgi:hypothetical protein
MLLFHSVAIEFSHGLDRFSNNTQSPSLPREKMLLKLVAFSI